MWIFLDETIKTAFRLAVWLKPKVMTCVMALILVFMASVLPIVFCFMRWVVLDSKCSFLWPAGIGTGLFLDMGLIIYIEWDTMRKHIKEQANEQRIYRLEREVKKDSKGALSTPSDESGKLSITASKNGAVIHDH